MRSSHGASGKSTRHWAAISIAPVSLFICLWRRSRMEVGVMPGHSCISASLWTTWKHSSRKGSRRSVMPLTCLVSSGFSWTISPLSSNRSGRSMRHDVGVGGFELCESCCPFSVIQSQQGQLIQQRPAIALHAGELIENALHHSHGRFVQQPIGARQIALISSSQAGEDHVIKTGNLLRRWRRDGEFLEKFGISLDGAEAKLQWRSQFVGALSQRIGLLGKIPYMTAEQDLHLHFTRVWHPTSQCLHEKHMDETEGADVLCPNLYGKAHYFLAILSIRQADSSGMPG